jgi:N-acetylglucosaminyl-diphospho-decaprenol L-rhamnosyltransferase
VSDGLTVVTVTYSPGPHLDRFLATLSHATERPVTVIMADNGSTDGAPEEAVQRYPNARLLHTGGNLGYGTAVNRAVAEITPESEFVMVANPDVQWGPRSIDVLLEAAERWPRAGSLGPLIRDPDGSVYPSARHLPSLIRGGMHAVIGPFWKANPWTAEYRQERTEPSERPVGWLSGSCLLLRRSAFDEISVIASARRGGRTYMCRRRRFCTTRVTRPAATRPATWRPTTPALTLSWQIGIRRGGRRHFGGR